MSASALSGLSKCWVGLGYMFDKAGRRLEDEAMVNEPWSALGECQRDVGGCQMGCKHKICLID
jgi:hypothetical protein